MPSFRQARFNRREQYSLPRVHDHAAHVAAAGGRGHVQGRDDQVGVMTGGHRVAEKATGEQVDDRRQVQLALAGFDLGEIARPDEIGFLGGEVPAYESACGGRPLARNLVSDRRRRTFRPASPSSAMTFATVFTDTRQPLRTSSMNTFGEP